MKKIVILTGSELRHDFFRKYIGSCDEIEVLQSFCEGRERSLQALTEKDLATNESRLRHLSARVRCEEDFFGLYVETTDDQSHPCYLPKGKINTPEYTQAIIDSQPDLLIAYGCSIIREPLLSEFEGRFLNVHLGLSPYYRGGGTNYWPLVNGEPEYVGATFMHIDAGVDTGEIIHQIRARYAWGDTPSQIGNRLISEMSRVYADLIVAFDDLKPMPQLPIPDNERVYRLKNYSEESVETLYRIFSEGLVEEYLASERERCAKVPILQNPALRRGLI